MDRKSFDEGFGKKRIVLVDGKIDGDMASRVRSSIVHLNLESDEDIRIVIDSAGGQIVPMLHIFDLVKFSRAKVVGIVNGLCHSSATILLQACHVRKASAHSTFLLHFVRTEFDFKAHEPIADVRRRFNYALTKNKRLQGETEEILSKRSGRSVGQIRKHMIDGEKHDVRLTAEQAKELGFLDEVLMEYDLFS